MGKERSYSTRFGEGTTSEGQFLRFQVDGQDPAALQNATEALGLFKRIDTVSSHPTVEHGAYASYTRYDVEKLEYYANSHGYYEILNIHDAPEGRHPIVSHAYFTHESSRPTSYFAEWETAEDAKNDVQQRGIRRHAGEVYGEEPPKGLVRAVELGMLRPWFYAVGDTELVGDYAFPESLAGHPVFTIGRRFIVPEKETWYDGIKYPVVRTSMGAFSHEERPTTYEYGRAVQQEPRIVTTVQWDDGTLTEITKDTPSQLVPVAIEQQPWIAEALDKVQAGMAGRALSFTVNFVDGSRFEGRFVEARGAKSDSEGEYYARVTLKDGTVRQGSIPNGFTPSPEYPTVASLIHKKYEELGLDIENIHVEKGATKPNGKKWKGLYHALPPKLVEE